MSDEIEPSLAQAGAILDDVTAGVAMCDREGRLTYVNARAMAFAERSRAELVGSPTGALLPGLAGAALAKAVDRSLRDGEPFDLVTATETGDHWYRTEGRPHTDGHVLTTYDITSEKRAELSALAQASQLRLVTDTARAYISYCDLDRRFRFVNRAFVERFDVTPKEVLGRTLAEVLGEEASAAIEPYVDAALSGQLVEFDLDVPYRTYGSHYMHCTYAPDLGENHEIRGFVAVISDISERRRAELEREAVMAELEIINRISSLIASELNLERLVQVVTDEATRLSRAQFGSFFYNVIGDQGESYMLYTLSGVPREAFERFPMPRNTAIFDPTFKGEGIVRSDDITKDPNYGKSAPYHGMPAGHLPVRSYLAVSVVSRSGEVVGGLFFGHAEPGVFTEEDERIVSGVANLAAIAMDNARLFEASQREKAAATEARQRAEEANRAKDEFLAMVSHELRTPLNSMLGWLRLLRSGRLDEASFERGLETVERNTVSQAQLIEDLLDVSRIITGKLRLTVEPVDLQPVIQAAIESVRLAAEARGVRLQTVLDSNAGLVSGDRERLQQVVWNLLSNAIKFTPRNGRVRVELRRVHSSVEVAVVDTGQGIPPELLTNVFDRFWQADASITRKHGGLGLGLAIVRHLVELHGGTVHAESQGDGHGATFVVRLPLTPVRRDPTTEQARSTSMSTIAGFECPPTLVDKHVLVVDDEADTRELLAAILGECGARVRVAGSADSAIEILDEWEVDVLVSDIGMPIHDGYELIKRVRARPDASGGTIPAIALTAYARFEDRMRALSSGFQMHVAKPVEPAELVMVIHSLLEFSGKA